MFYPAKVVSDVPVLRWTARSRFATLHVPVVRHGAVATPRVGPDRASGNGTADRGGVLSKMGPQIQWLHSYVTGDKIYCVYIAPNERMVREHAQQGGFPANRVSEVASVIDPTTAE